MSLVSSGLPAVFRESGPGRDTESSQGREQRAADATIRGRLSATGYIVAHHKIEANSKVKGAAWPGSAFEKGDKVNDGKVLVRWKTRNQSAR